MSQIKERPILFSAPMVRAVLDGRKTVTRRPVKVQPRSRADIGSYGKGQPFIRNPDVTKRNPECPFGNPGDRLWVRETWYCDHNEVMRGPYLKPDDLDVSEARDDGTLVYAADGLTPYEADQPVWKPSIHMPLWACRILLEITDVRVERLQDISDEQAQAEGCFFTDYGRKCGHSGKGWTEVGDCRRRRNITRSATAGCGTARPVMNNALALRATPSATCGTQLAETGTPTPGSGSSSSSG